MQTLKFGKKNSFHVLKRWRRNAAIELSSDISKLLARKLESKAHESEATELTKPVNEYAEDECNAAIELSS